MNNHDGRTSSSATWSRLGILTVTLGLFGFIGCSAPSALVTGRVTCHGKPVVGTILFSPKGEGGNNMGVAVPAELKDDGSYELKLKSTGKHTIVITPRDIKYPVPPGEFDYPCDRTPVEREIVPGENAITIEMTARTR